MSVWGEAQTHDLSTKSPSSVVFITGCYKCL